MPPSITDDRAISQAVESAASGSKIAVVCRDSLSPESQAHQPRKTDGFAFSLPGFPNAQSGAADPRGRAQEQASLPSGLSEAVRKSGKSGELGRWPQTTKSACGVSCAPRLRLGCCGGLAARAPVGAVRVRVWRS